VKKIELISIRAVIVVILTLIASIAMADEFDLPKLMQILAQSKASKATFIERKYIGIVDKPIESSGELAFIAPDKLTKRTLKPKFESLVLEGDNLTIDQPGKHQFTVNLLEHPEISAFVASVRGTLAGNRFALEEFYTLNLSGSVEAWKLVLVPKQSRMIKIISRIQISGSYANIGTINFDQGDGDRSAMVITQVVAE
jgi:hypothetical protein